MFQTRAFIFMKMASYTDMVQYVLHTEITLKGFYKRYKHKTFELFKYSDMNIKHGS